MANQNEPGRESTLLPLIEQAQTESGETGDRLMHQLRSYFHLLARNELAPALRQKVGNSDLVQQSCVKVIEGIQDFRGTSEGELRNWLKRIMTNEINQLARNWRAQKRDVRREVSLAGDSRRELPATDPADSMLTPRANALEQEKRQLVTNALSRLPEEYQQVIKMRSWQEMTFPQIANRLGKSINATEKLWYRAIQRLRTELKSGNEQSR